MKKILFPTDFSENSWNAIQYALQLFQNHECTFYLLNTYTPMIYNTEYMEINNVQFDVIDVMKKASEDGLQEILDKIENQYQNKKHSFVKISSFNTLLGEIEEMNKQHAFDFVVMGTKGATGLKEILFGSNTVHVIKNTKCPVLGVPSNYSFEKPSNILFPSDFGVSFKGVHIQPIIDIASPYNSKVHILNALYENDLSATEMKNKKKLDKLFQDTGHFAHSVSSNDVMKAIADFQEKTNIELLVMINNKHSFFENLFFKSKVNQIGFHIQIPFLIIPSKK